MNAEGSLVVRYGGRWALIYSAISVVVFLAIVGMRFHGTSAFLDFILVVYFLSDSFVVRETVFDHRQRKITRQWMLFGKLRLFRRDYSFDDFQAILLRWRSGRVFANLGGYGLLDVFLVGRGRRNLALQSYQVRDSETFCPQADILVHEVKELTDFPTESVESTSQFS